MGSPQQVSEEQFIALKKEGNCKKAEMTKSLTK